MSSAFPVANAFIVSPSEYVQRTGDFSEYCRCIGVIQDYYGQDSALSYLDELPDHVRNDIRTMLPGEGKGFLPKALHEWAHGTTFDDDQDREFAAELCAIPDELYKDEVDHVEDIPLSKYLRCLLPAYERIRKLNQIVRYEIGEADSRAPIDSLIEGFGTDRFSRSANAHKDPEVIFRREPRLRLCNLLDIRRGVPSTLPSGSTSVNSMLLLRPSMSQWSHISKATADLPFAALPQLQWQEDRAARLSLILLSAEHKGKTEATDRIVYSLATNQRQRQAIGLPRSVQYGLACEERMTHVIASFFDSLGKMITMVKVAVISHSSLADLLKFCHFLDAIRRRGHMEMTQLTERFAEPITVPEDRYWRHRDASLFQPTQPVRIAERRDGEHDDDPEPRKRRRLDRQRTAKLTHAKPTASGRRRTSRQEDGAPQDHIQYMDPSLFILFSRLDSGELVLSPDEEEQYQRALAGGGHDVGPQMGTSYLDSDKDPIGAWLQQLEETAP